MRKSHFILAFGLSGPCAVGSASATTLNDATEIALLSSPRLAAVRADYLASTTEIAITASLAKPQFRFSAQATHDFDHNPTTPQVRNESTLSFKLPLYSGGRIRNEITASRLRSAAAADELAASADELRLSVAESYDRVLDARDQVRIVDEEADALRQNLAMVGYERREGAATRTDEAQATARVSQIAARRDMLFGSLEGARSSYREVVGAEPDALTESTTLPIDANLAQLTEAAINYSPNLRALRSRIEAATHDVEATRSMRRPTISFVASVSYGNTDMRLAETQRFPQRLFAQFGFSVTVPLYLNGQATARIASAEAALNEAEANAETGRRRLIAEVRTSYDAYQGALRDIEAADAASEAAQRALEGVRIEHTAGTRTALDLLNAQREVSESTSAAARARRQAHLEAIILLVRTGAHLATQGAETAPAHQVASAATTLLKLNFDLRRMLGSTGEMHEHTLAGPSAESS